MRNAKRIELNEADTCDEMSKVLYKLIEFDYDELYEELFMAYDKKARSLTDYIGSDWYEWHKWINRRLSCCCYNCLYCRSFNKEYYE